ncbi:MAG: M20/M25/M40 family metallo-hydrolase [Planctomycetota bacterium]
MSMLRASRWVSGVSCLLLAANWLPVFAGDVAADSERRLLDDVKFLASDELEGRGIGLKGLDLAAEHIRTAFEKAGLNVTAVKGGAFQPFEMTTSAKLGAPNSLTIQGPDGVKLELKPEVDFIPLSIGASGKVAGNLVFCGYGIDAADKQYNDYAGLDVKGQIVVIMRREPRLNHPQGGFGGPHGGQSSHADLRTKVSTAFGRGAAGVLFVDDPHSAQDALEKLKEQVTKQAAIVAEAAQTFEETPATDAEKSTAARQELSKAIVRFKETKTEAAAGAPDKLMKFGYGGSDSARDIPLAHITRHVADQVLQAALKTTLADIEKEIDKDLKPRSATLAGWTVSGEFKIERNQAVVKNVIGVLEGSGPLADETVVIGAHYDHVGRGGRDSLSPGSTEIHNGADDNASGTASLLELARRLAARPEKPARRIVFIAFTAEESGLLGSAKYCQEPVFPLEKTIAMLNMDMVGRLVDNKLTVFGTGTSPHWNGLLEKLGKAAGFELTMKPEGFGPSDQSSFYAKKIPVLHFFTGNHPDYHRPSDDWEKINVAGMEKVTDLIEQVALDTINTVKKPEYVAIQSPANPFREGSRPYFGSIPDFGTDKPGYALAGVGPGSPAEKGGLKAGDRIIQINQTKIGNLEDFDLILRKFSAGEVIEVTAARGEQDVKLKITLGKPR